jgi:hypothetical protein
MDITFFFASTIVATGVFFGLITYHLFAFYYLNPRLHRTEKHAIPKHTDDTKEDWPQITERGKIESEKGKYKDTKAYVDEVFSAEPPDFMPGVPIDETQYSTYPGLDANTPNAREARKIVQPVRVISRVRLHNPNEKPSQRNAIQHQSDYMDKRGTSDQ